MRDAKGTVIVTGGAGFIGSHTVVELSRAGYRPVIVDNFSNSERFIAERIERILEGPVKLHEVDCNDGAAFGAVLSSEANVCGVIHFAAFKSVNESLREPFKYYQNNIGSLATVLAAIREAKIAHFVFSSSCTVYGEPDSLPVTEDFPQKPAESPYGRTKQIGEALIEDAVRSGMSLKVATLRYFNPIGAHPSGLIGELPEGVPDNLVPYITQTAAGIREKLTVYGDDYDTVDGSCVRDYIHVVDLARAHVKALDYLLAGPEGTFNEPFNLGTGRGVSVLQAIAAFEAANGTKLNFVIGPRREGDVVEIYANADKAERELKWTAELDTETAMRDAWNWQKTL